MATAKQLAALKKGREALAKKRGKKAAHAKAKKLRESPTAKAIVEVKLQSGAIGYLTSHGALDTDKSVAGKFSPGTADKKAREFFSANKKYLQHVRVIEIKK